MSSGFVTETELAEARKRRQEEWEKVRTPDQPEERPEEPYDGRSLFDRLKEQKQKKDMEFEEAHKLKNLIRGLDDDEVQFLELVDRSKMNAEKIQMREEAKELREFRDRVATLQEESEDKKIQAELKQLKATTNSGMRPSQKTLLGVGIKRKNGESSSTVVSSKIKIVSEATTTTTATADSPTALQSIATSQFDCGQLKCVAVLPGIGTYTESSDSELSSGSDEETIGCPPGKYDLVGRKTLKKKKDDC